MEHNNKMEPTIIDYIGLRTLRQDENDNRALAALLDSTTIIPHSCNQKHLYCHRSMTISTFDNLFEVILTTGTLAPKTEYDIQRVNRQMSRR